MFKKTLKVAISIIIFSLLVFYATLCCGDEYDIFDKLTRHEDFSSAGAHLIRQARSIEGAPCDNSKKIDAAVDAAAADTTTERRRDCSAYPYTTCNAIGQCMCNLKQAVRLELLPGYAFCLPIQYAIDTQRCLPTEPDVCSLAFAGSKCTFQREVTARATPDSSVRHAATSSSSLSSRHSNDGSSASTAYATAGSSGSGEWRCQCAIDGVLSNCKLYVGMSCTNNASLCANIGRESNQMPTVECNSTSDGDPYATCMCALGTEQSRDRLRCMARQCPRQGTTAPSPCRGASYDCFSPGNAQYVAGSGRFYCGCRDVGVNHSEYIDGLCCALGNMPCADFSGCISQTSLCDGVKDCSDCSDEELRICARPLPKDPQCARPVLPRSSLATADPSSDAFLAYPAPGTLTTGDLPITSRASDILQQNSAASSVNSILSPKLDSPAQMFITPNKVHK